MNKPFLVSIGVLRNQAGSRMPLSAHGRLEDLSVSGSAVPSDVDVVFNGQIEAMDASEQAVVTGDVSTEWYGDCRRCNEIARGSVTAQVREIFEPNPTEGETYALTSSQADLEPMIREAVMLELPEAPLCKWDCAGLCAECGINKNEASCTCDTEIVDIRWAALDTLSSELPKTN